MILDVVAILMIAFGFYIGFSRGIIKTVFAALSIIIGIVVTLKLSPILIGFFQNTFEVSPVITFIAGLVVTFLISLFIIRFIGDKIEGLFEAVNLNFINKIVGGSVMAFLFAIIISYPMFFMTENNLIKKETMDESITYSLLEPVPRLTENAVTKLKPVFREFWDKMLLTLDKVNEKAGTEDIELGEF